MRLTITGANSRFARAVIAELSGSHILRAVDRSFDGALPAGVEAVTGDIRDRDFAGTVTDDADGILHLAPLAIAGMDDSEVIDTFSRGSYNLADMAIEQGVSRFLLGSTLAMFDRLPAQWRVDEGWRPRPEPVTAQLACWLSELSLRESCHTAPIHAVCLRFGELVEDAETANAPYDPRWLHVEDAVQAVVCGLRRLDELPTRADWEIYHITSGNRAKVRGDRARGDKFGYRPKHDFADLIASREMQSTGQAAPGTNDENSSASLDIGAERASAGYGKRWRDALRPISIPVSSQAPGPPAKQQKHRVVIFGSGGPVAAALADELRDEYILRQTDVRPLADVRGENHPQSEGAPLPTILKAPHEEQIVDVRDYAQVLSACGGMDVVVNCTVVRPDAVEAFRVNTLGAYNVVRAAVECDIRRVVQTGPQQLMMDGRCGYWWDYHVPGNAPARPGRNLYAHSKFLGQEICRVYAENYGLEIPVLVYAQFLNPRVTSVVWTMAVSWQDSARALRRAVEVEALPSNYEEIVITSDLPHDKFSAKRAEEILGWQAQDDLSALWTY